MLTTLKEFWIKNDIVIAAAIISFLLSLTAYNSNDPINYDGILYLEAAAAYLKHGLTAALEIYRWPFYSILIAWTSTLTHLSLLHAAKLINCIFAAIIAGVFVNISRDLTINRNIHFAAAITILLYPHLNGYRDLIIRDFGYWAFLLIACWQLLRYTYNCTWRNAFNWNLAILLATQFRIEGAIVFMLAPLALLFLPQRTLFMRLQVFLKLFCVPIIALLSLVLWRHIHSTPSSGDFGRIPELINTLTNGWQLAHDFFATKITVIQSTVLPFEAAGDAQLWLIFGFAGTFIATLVICLHPLFAFLTGHSLIKHLLQGTRQQKIVLSTFAIINLLIPFCFFAQHFFLSERYLVAACLILLIWAPFSLHYLYAHLSQKRWLLWPISALLLIIGLTSVIHMGYSKAYITEAGNWLNANTSSTATIYSNSQQVLFYAKRTPIDRQKIYATENPLAALKKENWQQYNFIAIWIKHTDTDQEKAIISLIGRAPVQSFSNKRGDKVIIFR